MVELKSITKCYGDFAAVKNLDLEVRDGEILGIVGHNGAGKTTTLKMIMGLIEPTSGSISIMGKDMSREGTYLKRFIGYLPEESPLYENMTVVEYLLFFAELYNIPTAEARARVDELLGSLNLAEKERRTGELSKGMKRKVAIARALLHRPALLILDEPNSGLDPLTSFFIIDYLKKLHEEGATILLSAHNLFHIEYICDRVAIMKNGELLLCDTMDAIRKSLGQTRYEVVFKTEKALDYPVREGNYLFSTSDVGEIAGMLRRISDNGWALVDLSVRQSALEEIYVKLMTGQAASRERRR